MKFINPTLLLLLVSSLSILPPSSSATFYQDNLSEGSSLSVQNPENVLISANGVFAAGFYPVGINAYCFSIWFRDPSCPNNCTVVWMANRDMPVNGRRSKLSLLSTGNLILTDAGQCNVWSTNTLSLSSFSLHLQDTGNLILITAEGVVLWQSFDSPTDTLLPWQPLTRNTKLVSSRSQSNYSSGFYKLSFGDDNVLRLLYDGPDLSSTFWPEPWLLSRDAGRSSFNSSRIASLDSFGKFTSSDNFTFRSVDYGARLQRRLTLNFDGHLRLYSRENERATWVVSWQAISQACRLHGACGPNSACLYIPNFGRKCSCLPGFTWKNHSDWSSGCEPEFSVPIGKKEATFLLLSHVEMYGYDYQVFLNHTVDMCKEKCLEISECKGFLIKYIYQNHPDNVPYCFPKTQLLNGFRAPSFRGDLYLKLPKTIRFSHNWPDKETTLDCSAEVVEQLDRTYEESHGSWSLKFLLWLAGAVGAIEILGLTFVWLFLMRTHQNRDSTTRGYVVAGTGFKRFTYTELKKATKNFREEVGRGAGGVVYKGILPDHRVVAIKLLNEANRGEAEFLAEVSTIGKLNHMNLIDILGFCAEGKHRLLVYEYMEHGSLAENLSSGNLDWKKRFEIALGTAKGLAYLHEECLEWVLHCDVKPQNILLDSDYNPKVSDFGLSRLLRRGDPQNLSFSRIRGTRGYLAPEWVSNRPITSKVDVYSYGIVMLEMVTGMSPLMRVNGVDEGENVEHRSLAAWLKEENTAGEASMSSSIEEFIDPNIGSDYDPSKLKSLVRVALQCVDDDKDARPTMSQVVEMLLHHEKDY